MMNSRQKRDVREIDRIVEYRNAMTAFGVSTNTREEILEWLVNIDFFAAPASLGHHGAYEGGLFDHSLCVAKMLLLYTERLGLRWEYRRSPLIVGLFHDLCKADNYERDERGVWRWNIQAKPGHGEKSVNMLLGAMAISQEEADCITWHMGAFDERENWGKYESAIQQHRNVLYTHTADIAASVCLQDDPDAVQTWPL